METLTVNGPFMFKSYVTLLEGNSLGYVMVHDAIPSGNDQRSGQGAAQSMASMKSHEL